MAAVLVDFLIFGAIFAAATIPLTLVCRQLPRRAKTPRRWHIGAGVSAAVCAALGWSSRDLIDKCLNSNKNDCVDGGGAGMQLIIAIFFVGWALLSAYLIHND